MYTSISTIISSKQLVYLTFIKTGQKQKIRDEPSYLVLASMLHHFLIDDLVHHLEPFDRLLLRDADILLLQWNRSVRVIKEEQTAVEVDSKKPGNIAIVR